MMATTLPKSMVGIFHDLHRNREEARQAQVQYVVVSLTKKGVPAKVTAQDKQYTGTRTIEEATATQARMAALNPGKTFVIVTL